MNDALALDSLKQIQAPLEAAGLKTPVRAVTTSAEGQSRAIYLKPENLQPTGSFNPSEARRKLAEQRASEHGLALSPPYDEHTSCRAGIHHRDHVWVAGAIKVALIGEKIFPLIQQYVDDIVLVSEEQIINAIPFAEKHTGAPVEPAGAVAVAAALWKSTAQDVLAVVTGANISPERRQSLVASMSAGA